jgi:hypothetical protein
MGLFPCLPTKVASFFIDTMVPVSQGGRDIKKVLLAAKTLTEGEEV